MQGCGMGPQPIPRMDVQIRIECCCWKKLDSIVTLLLSLIIIEAQHIPFDYRPISCVPSVIVEYSYCICFSCRVMSVLALASSRYSELRFHEGSATHNFLQPDNRIKYTDSPQETLQ